MLYYIEAIHYKENQVLDTRIFGVFTEDSLDKAREIVRENVSDLYEFYYRYMAIVKIPDNTLYVDCYRELFELYKVKLPPHETAKELDEKFKEIKFEKIDKSEAPEAVRRMYSWIDLATGEISTEMKAEEL